MGYKKELLDEEAKKYLLEAEEEKKAAQEKDSEKLRGEKPVFDMVAEAPLDDEIIPNEAETQNTIQGRVSAANDDAVPYAPGYKPEKGKGKNDGKKPKNPLQKIDNQTQGLELIAEESMYGLEKIRFKNKLSDLNDLKEKLNAKYDADKDNIQWQELAERLAHALTQIGAGMAGMKSGADMSSLKFDKKDYSKDLDRILTKYSADLNSIDKDADRASSEYQFGVTTQLTKDKMAQDASQFDDTMKFNRDKLAADKANEAHKARIEGKYKLDEKKLDTALKLSDRWANNKTTEKTGVMASSYAPLKSLTDKRIKGGKNAAGVTDLTIIVEYMKMIDPGSVVREGEVEVVRNTANMPEDLKMAYQRITGGENNVLSDRQVKEIRSDADLKMKQQLKVQKAFDEGEAKYAVRMGLEPEDVVKQDFAKQAGLDGVSENAVPGAEMTPQDRAAMKLISENPNHPDAEKIRKILRSKGLLNE